MIVKQIGYDMPFSDERLDVYKVGFSKTCRLAKENVNDKLRYWFLPNATRIYVRDKMYQTTSKSVVKINPDVPVRIETYDNVDLTEIVLKEKEEKFLDKLKDDPNRIEPGEKGMNGRPAIENIIKGDGLMIFKEESRFRNPGWYCMFARASEALGISQGDFFDYARGSNFHFHEMIREYTLCFNGSIVIGTGEAEKTGEKEYIVRKDKLTKVEVHPWEIFAAGPGEKQVESSLSMELPYEHLCFTQPSRPDKVDVKLVD